MRLISETNRRNWSGNELLTKCWWLHERRLRSDRRRRKLFAHRQGHLACLYNPRKRRGLFPKFLTSWEWRIQLVKGINNVFVGDYKEEHQQIDMEWAYGDLIAQNDTNHKARFGVANENQDDLFLLPDSNSVAHCVVRSLEMCVVEILSFQYELQDLLGHLQETIRD